MVARMFGLRRGGLVSRRAPHLTRLKIGGVLLSKQTVSRSDEGHYRVRSRHSSRFWFVGFLNLRGPAIHEVSSVTVAIEGNSRNGTFCRYSQKVGRMT
jgi:hypothetical protein